jgi:hypothetical protein
MVNEVTSAPDRVRKQGVRKMSGENLLQARVAFADEIRSKASIRSASLIDGLARADARFRDAGI